MTDRGIRLRVRGRTLVALTLIALTAGCVTFDEKVEAARSVSRVFCEKYEAIISERGTRIVHATRDDAYTAMRAALASVGMQVESQSPKLGIFSVHAPAPLPLQADEFERTSAQDLPLLRQIARPHVGWLTTRFLHFEPSGVEVVITATILKVPEGSSVSLTVRLRELRPPPSGFPRRECLSPTVVVAGLDKIWAAFERELAGAGAKS